PATAEHTLEHVVDLDERWMTYPVTRRTDVSAQFVDRIARRLTDRTAIFTPPHLRRQGSLIPHRGRGVANRARPVAGITDDGILVGTCLVGRLGVLACGSAGRTVLARVHVSAGTNNQEGRVPAATDTERVVQHVHLLPCTVHPLAGRVGVAQGLAELLPCRLGSGAPVGEAHPFAGRCDHLLVALAPVSAGTLAVADSPVQRIDVPTH